jgi:ABC-type multidrug transport system ATPase subunit
MKLILEDIWYAYPGHSSQRLIEGRTELEPGTAVAVIGGNGTGKTTVLKIIAGLIKNFCGIRVVPSEWRLSFVPTVLHNFLLPWYTAEENLSFYASAGKHLDLPSTEFARDWAELLGRKEASSLIKRPCYRLSSGEQAVLSLLCAFAPKPKVLLLDELFANASISTANRMLTRLEAFKNDQGLIIFTTHQKTLAERLASQFIDLERNEILTG